MVQLSTQLQVIDADHDRGPQASCLPQRRRYHEGQFSDFHHGKSLVPLWVLGEGEQEREAWGGGRESEANCRVGVVAKVVWMNGKSGERGERSGRSENG